jgi:hypothetical protein
MFEDALNVPFPVENSNDAEGVSPRKVIDTDGLKSCDRPRTQILKLRVARTIARTHKRMLAQRLNGAPDRIPEANGHVRKTQRDEVMAKLSHNIVAGG